MNKTFKLSAMALAAVVALSACKEDKAAAVNLETDVQKISYAIGTNMGMELAEAKKNGAEFDVSIIAAAIADQLEGKESKMTPEQMGESFNKLMQKMQENAEKAASENLAKGKQFLEENKTKEGVQTTASGLQYIVKKEGTGETAKIGDLVVLSYVGTLIDGTEFDGSNGEKVPFPVSTEGLIAGFAEGLQLMKAGGEYTLYIPAELAYGELSPSPAIAGNSVLIFEIQVSEIEAGAAKQ